MSVRGGGTEPETVTARREGEGEGGREGGKEGGRGEGGMGMERESVPAPCGICSQAACPRTAPAPCGRSYGASPDATARNAARTALPFRASWAGRPEGQRWVVKRWVVKRWVVKRWVVKRWFSDKAVTSGGVWNKAGPITVRLRACCCRVDPINPAQDLHACMHAAA